MKKDVIIVAIGAYVLLMSVYWFVGTDSVSWAYYYYFIEKSFAGFGFWLLYRYSSGLFVRNVAIYCMSLCLFMILYFVFTRIYGHSNWLTVGSFLVYSVLVLTIIRIRS